MKKTFPDFHKYPVEAKEQSVMAHKYMKMVFEDALSETNLLNYETGKFSDKYLPNDFYNSITSTAGKSRHGGFHMAVVGRLPPK